MEKLATTLYQYHWRGKNVQGIKSRGKMLAYTEAEVRQQLKQEQISPSKIKQRHPSLWTKKQHITTSKDITLFSRQMATMLNAGLPLNDTLSLIKTGAKKAQMKQIITQIQNHLESGASFSAALKNSSALFDKFYCELISIGEQTGKLNQVLERVAVYREKNEALRSKAVKVMIYPCVVFVIALIIAIIMLIFVIPTFSNIFTTFDAELPWFTQKILHLSDYLQQGIFYWLFGVGVLTIALKKLLKQSYATRLLLSKHALQIPLLGSIMTKAAIARFIHTLATTYSAGIPLLTGLTTARNTIQNTYFKRVILNISKQISGGKPLYLAIRESGAFPDTMMQMIMIGEESGALDKMLYKIAILYEEQVDNRMDNLGKLFEPLIIIVLGLLIGALVVAIYLPMFNLMSVM